MGMADRLTIRQREILTYMAAGWQRKNVASALGLSPSTIRNHVTALLARYGAVNSIQAVAKALMDGDIEPAEVLRLWLRRGGASGR